LWQGASLLDGKPIVVIATGFAAGGSANRKTGPMIQTWILRADVEPHLAVKNGDDASICGTCPHRGEALGDSNKGRACYVLVHNAPLAVYRAWKRASYGQPPTHREESHKGWLASLGANRAVRLGAYGDPAAVPFWVWEAFAARARNFTGYTHAWKTCDPALQLLCMASCDNAGQVLEARALGWRSFRVAPQGSPLTTDVRKARNAGYVICPASEERGKRTTCDKCGLCRGTRSTAPDIIIAAHGSGAKKAKVS